MLVVWDTETSALLKDIDTSSDRPAIADFSTHYRPKSILSTPDQSTELAELTRLPGFAPSTLQELEERFPSDERERLTELTRLPGFAPSNIEPLQESFPVHEEDISDWIFLKDKTEDTIIQELTGRATEQLLGELPNVQGGYGDNIGLRIKEACEQLYNEPKHENKVIAGADSLIKIKDIERITETYGGTEQDWVKLSSKHIEYNKGDLIPKRHVRVQLHWYENIKTGETVEVKPVISNRPWKVPNAKYQKY